MPIKPAIFRAELIMNMGAFADHMAWLARDYALQSPRTQRLAHQIALGDAKNPFKPSQNGLFGAGADLGAQIRAFWPRRASRPC